MARIPEETINRIKQDISLLRLVQSQGYTVTRQGKDHVVSCPFHDEQTPSCIISPKTNLFNCFGCGAGGSVIDWVMKTQGLSFRFACELLQKDLGLIVERGTKTVTINRSTKLPTLLDTEADSQTALRQVVEYYHQSLKHAPEVLAYLQSRGLNHPELIERFKLGFANRTLGYRLPAKHTQEGAALRGELQRLGIYRASGHEHFNGSLVVPVIDTQGDITEMYGRKITKRLRPGTPKHLYLPGEHRGVWNAEGLENQQVAPAHPAPATLARPCTSEVILCEALIDAMTFWVNGYRNVTASYGTSGFTDDHLALFKQLEIKRILIAYDRDEAGNNAAAKLAKQLQAEGFDCYRLHFPKGMDANQYARAAPGVVPPAALEHPCSSEVTPASKSLGVVIRSAEWMGEGSAPERQLDIHMQTGQPEPKVNRARPSEQKAPTVAPTSALAAVPVADETPITPPRIEAQPEPTAPAPPASDLQAEVTEQAALTHPASAALAERRPEHPCASEITLTLGSRCYRVRGLGKNKHYDVLKVNMLASNAHDVQGRTNAASAGCAGAAVHVDTFDLYHAKQRQQFIKLAAIELAVQENTVKNDMGRVLLKLEELQAQRLEAEQETDTHTALSEQEQQEALALLRDPDVLNRILADFNRCGVVGEEVNKLVGYLAAGSRKLDKPLAVIIQSTSAAGKSSLMDAVLNLMPEDERVQYSAMTGQSLFYMGETNLKNKILAIAEEEGASNASYALKLLQSEGEITIASTGKDDTTGNLVTREYKVQGPVMLFLTTTAIDIDEELLNRCLVLTVNESREQTRAIHEAQRKRRTLEGLQAKLEKDQLVKLHRNAQKLLKPLAVINPYADQLTFLDDKTRTRRDHEKYLTLIDSIALLHQYQRPIRQIHNGEKVLDYIEVTLSDIETANRLAHEVLGRTLDELAPQTRKLLALIQTMVSEACARDRVEQKDCRFSRRDIRAYTGWSDGQLKIHCGRLTDMEYLLVHQGGRGKSLAYELLFDGQVQGDDAHLMGLIDPEQLQDKAQMRRAVECQAGERVYDAQKSGANEQKSGQTEQKSAPSQGHVSPKSGPSQTQKNQKTSEKTGSNAIEPDNAEKSASGVKKIKRVENRSESDHTQSDHASPTALAASSL